MRREFEMSKITFEVFFAILVFSLLVELTVLFVFIYPMFDPEIRLQNMKKLCTDKGWNYTGKFTVNNSDFVYCTDNDTIKMIPILKK
jgi:hypothetical protein